MEYRLLMNIISETAAFADWLGEFRDNVGKARILARIRQAKNGNFGDCRPVGDGVSEMRVHVGPGYRLYYAQEGLQVYLLILGGDKSNQMKDAKRAKEIWREIKENKL